MKEYLIQPNVPDRFSGPTWRRLLIPAIGAGACWMVVWKWYKTDGDNWIHFKRNMGRQASEAWGLKKDEPIEIKANIPQKKNNEPWRYQ